MMRRTMFRLCDPAKAAKVAAAAAPGSMDPTKTIQRAEYILGSKEGGVVWREYWDVDSRKPYYHNIKENRVTWDMPDGFETTYPEYYATKITSSTGGSPGGSWVPKWLSKVQSYGPGGMILYGIVHFGMMGVIFVLLLLGVDFTSVAAWFGITLPQGGSLFATWVLSVAINKMFVPLQVMTTLSLAPKYAPMITAKLPFKFGKQ
eukprot:PhF_6_TR2538/c0_g1_i1/m.4310